MEVVTISHEWKEYNAKDFVEANNILGGNSVFPLHGVLRLEPMDERAKKQLKLHCSDLRKMYVKKKFGIFYN